MGKKGKKNQPVPSTSGADGKKDGSQPPQAGPGGDPGGVEQAKQKKQPQKEQQSQQQNPQQKQPQQQKQQPQQQKQQPQQQKQQPQQQKQEPQQQKQQPQQQKQQPQQQKQHQQQPQQQQQQQKPQQQQHQHPQQQRQQQQQPQQQQQQQHQQGPPAKSGWGQQQQPQQQRHQQQQPQQQQQQQHQQGPPAKSSWGQQQQPQQQRQQQQHQQQGPPATGTAWGPAKSAGKPGWGVTQTVPQGPTQPAQREPVSQQARGAAQLPQGTASVQQPSRGQESKTGSSANLSTQRQQPRAQGKSVDIKSTPTGLVSNQYDLTSASPVFNWCGKAGTHASIESNYLKLDITKMPNVAYHYDVQFDPDRPLRLRQPAFEQLRLTVFNRLAFAFDGRNMGYLAKNKLPAPFLTEHTVNFVDPDTNVQKTFKITIKETVDSAIDLSSLRTYDKTGIDLKPLRALQCIDVVLRSACYGISKQAGRAFYVKPPRPIDLTEGFELWFGLFQSAVLGQYPMVNIDVAHKGFPRETNAADLMIEAQKADRYNAIDPESFLRGLNIIYHPPACMNAQVKLYKYQQLVGPANSQTFVLEDQTKMTVNDYYKSKGYQIRRPELRCIAVGSSVRPIYYPPELCLIPAGQTVLKKAGANQVRAMIKAAATATDVRKQKIFDLFKGFDHNRNEIVRGFNIMLGDAFLKVLARVIDPPKLGYADQVVTPRGGSWRPNNVKYLQGAAMLKWGVLVLCKRINDSAVRNFAGMIGTEAKRLNMQLSNEQVTIRNEGDARKLRDQLNRFKADRFNIVFVVLPNFADTYAKVKQAAEIDCGLLTQCIKSQTIERRLDGSTISNILLKVNSKLNGVNHKLMPSPKTPVLDECVMFLGADVTHPSPDQSHIPSVVGVVASHDQLAFQYNICWRIQGAKVEMIADMENIVLDQLKYFKSKRNKLPDRIIYYRDGVSDGQFAQLKEIELNAVNRACAKAGPNYKPKITCLVVQKRHHTRFFPIPGERGLPVNPRDKYKNVPPGTIVDSTITHPGSKQFFLVSHESIQGTAKPAKYCVVRDDSNFAPDELQAITYYLCHMFTRCNRSVSYPAPAYYAHLVAARGRVYIEGIQQQNFGRLIVKDAIIKDFPMYFV